MRLPFLSLHVLLLLLLSLLWLLLVAPVSVSSATPPSSSLNLVSNPGFECSSSDLEDWSGGSSPDADAHEGALSARLGSAIDNSSSSTVLSQRLQMALDPATATNQSRCYAIQFWAKPSSSFDSADNELEATLVYDGQLLPLHNNTGSSTQLPITNGTWQTDTRTDTEGWQFFYFYVCPPAASSNSSSPGNGTVHEMRLRLRGRGFLIDDVSVAVQHCPDAAEFEAYLRDLLMTYRLPSVAVASVKQGVIVCAMAVGTKVFGEQLPVSVTDKYHIGSDTKAMTAVLAGMAVEEGLLGWDTRVADVFPELIVNMSEEFRQVNLTQLLSHSSGLGPEADFAVFTEIVPALDCGDTERNLEPMRYEVLKFLAARNLSTPPGTVWSYSNTGYMVAGHMVERVMNQTWEILISTRVFDGLDLRSAGLGCQATLGRIDAAIAHTKSDDGILSPFFAGPFCDNPAMLGPAGIAHMSVLDFASWAGWNAGAGRRGPPLVTAETLDRIHTGIIDAAPPNPTPGTPTVGMYALGWGLRGVDWAGAPYPLLYHGGSNNKNLAHIWADTRKDFAMVTMTNVAGVEADLALLEVAQRMYANLAGEEV